MTKITREAEAEYWDDKFKNANSSSDVWRVVREIQRAVWAQSKTRMETS